MNDEVLTPQKILDAAEEVFRRFGPAKATVVDVANLLGVSHGSVYRHFPSKAALRDAVTERWLDQVTKPLKAVLEEKTSPTLRLRHWLELLIEIKHKRASNDPELFATYNRLTSEAREVVRAHVEELARQIAVIIAEGVDAGEFTVADPTTAGRAVLDATMRFHNPIHSAEWTEPGIMAAFQQVWLLILNGLQVRTK